jgi:EAL domain-containing protein (putative c-di-GMP-specific phosphodiesterase class I)
MIALSHLIYSSAATQPFDDTEMAQLLRKARANNARLGVTGMLLYENGSFFQILEGNSAAITLLYQNIARDARHTKVVTIIQEPIAKRSFDEWTMGYSRVNPQELDEIVGLNDFFTGSTSFTQINSGRAKKLLAAFRDGRWRSRVVHTSLPNRQETAAMSVQPATMQAPKVSFAFQPIIDVGASTIKAYEAFYRGQHDESFTTVLPQISELEWSTFDTNCRAIAISMAAKLGLASDLHLKFMARHLSDARSAIHSTLEAATRHDIDPGRIVLEIDQDQLIGECGQFAQIIEDYRGAGLRVSIDHFGAGRAGLNLLEPLRPEMISLNADLIRGIENNGPRQAIVRGLLQTCTDLGIDLIAKFVETNEEYSWLCEEGINLIQGKLVASPGFEKLPVAFYPPN